MNEKLLQSVVDSTTELARSGFGGTKRGNYKLAATIIDKSGWIIKKAVNEYKTHPALLPFFKYPYLHAEANAILKTGLDYCKDSSIVVVRVRRDNGNLTMAKPCPSCRKLIEYVGIRSIYYTNWQGEIEHEDICNFIHN